MTELRYKVDFVAFHITQTCSHRCPFCYASSKPKDPSPDFDTLIEILRKLAEDGVKEIAFLGGDPCRYPKLVDLARVAKNAGLKTAVLSNTHIYHRSAQQVTEVVDCFETTFHGPSQREHDSIAMASGAFNLVLKNLRKIVKTGAKSIGAVYNITPQNYRLLFDTVSALIEKYKIPLDHLILQRIVPLGRGKETSQFSIVRSYAIVALEQVETLANRYKDLEIFFEDPFPFCVIPERFHPYLNRCEWGYTRVSVDSKGDLSRCGADPRYRLGNMLKKPLLQIWNESPTLNSFRSKRYLPPKCQQCDLLDRCGGGCALSCEIDLDHGIDYLFLEGRPMALGPQERFQLIQSGRQDLSQILRIEWASFPDYEFKFTPNNLTKWFEYNPKMFYVLRNSRNDVIGYACVIPLTQKGYNKIIEGNICSLSEMKEEDVLKGNRTSKFYHIEVIATVADVKSRAGFALIRSIADLLIKTKAEIITTSPITEVGIKLCNYFQFQKIAVRHTIPTKQKEYGIYGLKVRKDLIERVKRF